MSTESDTPEAPQPVVEPVQAPPPAAPAQPAFDPRRRLRELLAIPERDRTDPQWDEINELEIQLAPGNRVHPGNQGGPGGNPGGGGGGGGGGRHFQQKKHPPKGGGGGGGDKGGGGGKRRPRPGNPNKPQQ